jgi:hypothetical protein
MLDCGVVRRGGWCWPFIGAVGRFPGEISRRRPLHRLRQGGSRRPASIGAATAPVMWPIGRSVGQLVQGRGCARGGQDPSGRGAASRSSRAVAGGWRTRRLGQRIDGLRGDELVRWREEEGILASLEACWGGGVQARGP